MSRNEELDHQVKDRDQYIHYLQQLLESEDIEYESMEANIGLIFRENERKDKNGMGIISIKSNNIVEANQVLLVYDPSQPSGWSVREIKGEVEFMGKKVYSVDDDPYYYREGT